MAINQVVVAEERVDTKIIVVVSQWLAHFVT